VAASLKKEHSGGDRAATQIQNCCKEACRIEKVLAEIKRGSGTHFALRDRVRIAPPRAELNEELTASLKPDKSSLMLRPATV
jgi:hypothetical protein